MKELLFFDLKEVETALIKRVVIVSQYNNKLIYCNHKDRDTWEIPGGRIEDNELPIDAARRELYEETGAIDFKIEPICAYKLNQYAMLFYAKVNKIDKLPNFEIEKISFFDKEPTNLTYKEMHSKLLKKVQEMKGI